MRHEGTTRWFEDAFLGMGGGSPVMECSCGRVHYSDSPHYEPGEKDALDAKADANPKRYVYGGPDSDGVSYVDIDGQTYVEGCECQGPARIERLIWGNRARIIEYLGARLGEIANNVGEQLTALRAVAHPDTEVLLQVTPGGPVLPTPVHGCAEPGCGNRVAVITEGRGLCAVHEERRLMEARPRCASIDCTRPAVADDDWCDEHRIPF